MILNYLDKGYWFPVTFLFVVILLQSFFPFNLALAGDSVIAKEDLANQLQSPGNSYQAEIFVSGPVKGTRGERIKLTLTITELSDVSTLGSAVVLLPDLHGADGFSNYRINAVDSSVSGEKKWQSRLVEQNGRTYINLRAKSENDYLVRGELVSITFCASTPAATSTGTYEFKTRAWTDNRLRDSMHSDPQTGKAENANIMASGYKDPVVYVETLERAGAESYKYNADHRSSLRTELQAEGTGFDTIVFSTANSSAFLTTLELPAVHSFTTTYYEPTGNGNWNTRVIVENRSADLLQGYATGWRSYYHRMASPGVRDVYSSLAAMLREQAELENYDLDSLSESELRELANHENIDYYFTELIAQTEQVWFAAVVLESGGTGILVKDFGSSYGTTDYIFNEDGDLWPDHRGYQGPAYGFGFVQDGDDGYRIERGIDYPGSYIDLGQVADASKGKVIRYIDISSPYSNSFMREDMIVRGSGKVDEILGNVNIEPARFIDWPGSTLFSDDWDLWVFSEGSSRSRSFDAPFFGTDPPDSSTEPATESTTRDINGQELTDTDQAASSSSTSEEQEDEIVLPSGGSVAEGDGDDMDQFDPASEYVFDFAVDIEQGADYSTIIMISVIALLLALTILAILVVLIRNVNSSKRPFP